MNQSQLRQYIKTFLDKTTGSAHVLTATFDSDFVTGNVISGTINGTAFIDVPFNSSHSQTIVDLSLSIQNVSPLRKVQVTGARQLTLTAYDTNTTITPVITVTGGAIQASDTIATTTAASSIPVFLMNEKYMKDTEQCTFNIMNVSAFGEDGYRKVDAETNLSLLAGSRVATIALSYFGIDAFEKLSRVYIEMFSERWTRFFNDVYLAIINREQIVNTSELMETKYFERADFDFRIRYFDTNEENVGTIEDINIDSTIDDVAMDQIVVEY